MYQHRAPLSPQSSPPPGAIKAAVCDLDETAVEAILLPPPFHGGAPSNAPSPHALEVYDVCFSYY